MEGEYLYLYWPECFSSKKEKAMTLTRRATIQKFKRNVKGSFRYYFRKISSNGEILYCSPGYMTRGGRNKAVNRIREKENVNIESL